MRVVVVVWGAMMDGLIITSAGTGRRILAYCIDWFVLSIISGGAALALAVALYIALPEARADAAAEIIFRAGFPGAVALALLYFLCCWAIFGRSLGMALLGLRVVTRESPQLGGLPWGTAAARALGYLICWLTLGIGFFAGLHDTIAQTDAVTISRPLAQGYALSGPPAGL
jgi:uncharacterized RDD family membrane protein YckC